MCFKWAVTRALNPVEDNSQRITDELREQTEKYDWEGMTFPTKVKDIFVWERNNNISVNVFGYDDDAKRIYTIRIAELKDPISTINLFLHDDNQYCVVKDLGRLISDQLSGNDRGKDICLRCLNAFGRLRKKRRERRNPYLKDMKRFARLRSYNVLCIQIRGTLPNLKIMNDFMKYLLPYTLILSVLWNHSNSPSRIQVNHSPRNIKIIFQADFVT